MNEKRVILAGGSGFLGASLLPALCTNGYRPIVLTRGESRASDSIEYLHWDGRSIGAWQSVLDGVYAVINLAGRSVDCRYTAKNRSEIVSSRVESVGAISRALAAVSNPPALWLQAGSLAIYGDAGDAILEEDAPHGTGFSVEVCERWEQSFFDADVPGCRKVLFRIGFALGAKHGALEKLATFARFGLGGTAGPGTQYISWLHIEDLVKMFMEALEDAQIEGIYNATGPTPVTNAEFMRTLRETIAAPWNPPVPTWAIRVGSFFLRTEPELILKSRRALPARFSNQGFQFEYPDLRAALEQLFGVPRQGLRHSTP